MLPAVSTAYHGLSDTKTKAMKVVVDAHEEIGTDTVGFAAKAKFHTRNNVGASGKIYFGTKQGYPKGEEKRSEYLGGYPMVYDPETGRKRVYDIPVKHRASSALLQTSRAESQGLRHKLYPITLHEINVGDIP